MEMSHLRIQSHMTLDLEMMNKEWVDGDGVEFHLSKNTVGFLSLELTA